MENLSNILPHKRQSNESNPNTNRDKGNFFTAIFSQGKSKHLAPSELLANSISKLYPKGIQSLLSSQGPKHNDSYIILVFNCPSEFYEKYCSTTDTERKQLKGLNLFSRLISVENLNLATGLNDNIAECTEFNEVTQRVNIKQKIEVTNKFKCLLKELFEHFDAIAEELIETILEKHCQEKAKELKSQNELMYNKFNTLYKQILNNEDAFYHYFTYEDFIVIFSRIINYYLGLDIIIQFTEQTNIFMLSIYGSDNQIKKLAQSNEYELKLKPYAYKYQAYLNELENINAHEIILRDKLSSNRVNEGLIAGEESSIESNCGSTIKSWTPFAYEDLSPEIVYQWPPYVEFEQDKEDKFQRYDNNDDYHECNIHPETDEICKCCSPLRNIDKLRIIYDSVDKMIKINYMRQENILNYIMLKRNHVDYANKLTVKNLLLKPCNVYNSKAQMDHIFTIRNFYGETISFYFLWLTEYIKWLIIPSIFGLLTFISSIGTRNQMGISHELFILLFCSLFAIWGMLFLDVWKQKEKVFSYFWGTENFEHFEPDSELFVPDGTKELIFNVKFPYVSKFKKRWKMFVSYFTLFIMLVITVFSVLYIFILKQWLLKKEWNSLIVSMLTASLNAIQIKLLNYLYTFLARKLNRWENHQKDFQSVNALAVKFILFEFVNCYTAIYYIAFLKQFSFFGMKDPDKCVGYSLNVNGEPVEDCLEEIEMQLYTTFLINFGFNALELGLPLFNQFRKLKELKSKKQHYNILNSLDYDGNSKYDIIPHSLEHQLICDSYDDIISEYSEVLINFGYVCLFGVSAPLTPIIVFALLYAEKFVDTFKMFFLVRMEIIDGCNGIEIYNSILNVFIYLGLITNFAIVIFSDHRFVVLGKDHESELTVKIVMFVLSLIVILAICSIVKWNVTPKWFEYLGEIKELYQKKYYKRDEQNLPHYYLIERIEKKKRERKEKVDI